MGCYGLDSEEYRVKALCLTNEFTRERFGGAGTMVTGMVHRLVEQGVEQVVVVPERTRSAPGWDVYGKNLKVLWLPRNERYFGNLGLVNEFVLLDEFPELTTGWDLVHICASNFAPLAYRVCKKGIPLLYSVSSLLRVELGNDQRPELQVQFEVQEELLARSQRIHLLSESERQHMLKWYPWLMPRVVVLPIGTRPSGIHWQGGRSNTLLYVGRLIEYKGIEDLLKALRLLKMKGKQFPLDIVGKGTTDYERHLENLVHLGSQVRFHGWEERLDKIAEWMAKSALLVVPSHRESFGLVALEGMTVGIPLLASNAAALGELATPSYALTFPAGNIEALAQGIVRAFENPQLMRTLAQNAMNRAASLEWPKLAPRYLELYTSTLKVTCYRH